MILLKLSLLTSYVYIVAPRQRIHVQSERPD